MLLLLPDYADPERLCALGKAYEGEVALGEMPRLAAMLADLSGSARFRMAFERDAAKRCIVDVEVDAALALQCQRCLGTYTEIVSAHARLALVRGVVEAERLPAELDPLLVENEPIALRSLLEDELILAVPSAPMHRPEDCDVDLVRVNASVSEGPQAGGTGPAPTRPSPFAALQQLRRDNETKD